MSQSRDLEVPSLGENEPGAMLNRAQQRVVTVTMQRLERVLAEQDSLLRPAPALALNERILDVDDATAAELRALAEDARRELREIAVLCGLAPTRQSTRRMLQAALSTLWADLEDTRPRKLHGYGEVSPEALSNLGPPIDRLIALVDAMQSALAVDGTQEQGGSQR